MSDVRLGILGFAHGHVCAWLDVWHRRPELAVQAVAGWDHDARRASEACRQRGLEVLETPQALLARSDIDAVVVAAETSRHADLVVAAAEAGKAIILQKPLALTMEEANRVVEAVESAGVPFTLAWQMRVDPQNIAMKELIAGGELGKVFMVRRRHGLPTQDWGWIVDSWHVRPEENRDIWADDASHPIDFIYWLLGAPKSVTAEIGSLLNPRVPNDNGIAVFRYDNGVIAEVCCSFTCLAAENTTEIIAEMGSVVQNYGDVPSANVPRGGGSAGLKWYLKDRGDWTVSEIASPPNHGERIAALAEPFAEYLHGRRSPIATAREGRDVLRLVLACYRSSDEGRRVEA